MKKVLVLVLLVTFSFSFAKANEISFNNEKKTAESVLAFAATFGEMNDEAAIILRNEIKSLTVGERVKLANLSIKIMKEAKETGDMLAAKPALYILAVLLPPVAVGIHTEWDIPTLWNVCWCCVGVLPGIIHAFVVLGR